MIKYCNVNGLRTRYLMLGEGEPIILLHGWGTNLDSFLPMYSVLQKSMRVIAVDFPGFGHTDFPPIPWTVGDYTNWLISFLQALGVTSAYFLGHSFGGRVSIKLAASSPEIVKKLILVDSAGVRQFEINWRRKFYKELSRLTKPILYLLPKSWSQKVRWKFYQAISATDYLTAGRLKETYQNVINEDLEPILDQIKASTLLIWGKNDQTTPLSDAIIMSKKIINSKLIVVKGAGHYPFVDSPDDVNQNIITFLQD